MLAESNSKHKVLTGQGQQLFQRSHVQAPLGMTDADRVCEAAIGMACRCAMAIMI